MLQCEWNTHIETFAPGPDGGIDLRAFSSAAGEAIVQCKHYASSTFSQLLSHIRSKELQKIRKLKPKRYVLVTSVGLSPQNKSELLQALSPFVLSSADIIGREDLNNLLLKFPQIQQAHFKLWLTSAAVLERVLYNAELCQTEFEIDRIVRKLPLIVESKAYNHARSILDESRVLVVSGPPGIGKTTLADLLLYSHLAKGYQPVVMRSGVEEGRKLYRKTQKQIFYFDDFLGQTFLGDSSDFVEKNQDAALLAFIQAIQHSDSARFILTTREHILRTALRSSEKLLHSEVLADRCVLQLQDYSVGQRARILYNHLYFSDLPEGYRASILNDDFYLSVIKSEHFNPRLVEWLSSYSRIKKVSVDKYQKYVSDLLKHPYEIWRHAFEREISEASRNVLLCMASRAYGGNLAEIREVWDALHSNRAAQYHYSIAPHDYRDAMKELEGSFLRINNGYVSYSNPTVRDFIQNIIETEKNYVRDILGSAKRFDQIAHLLNLAIEGKSTSLLTSLLDDKKFLSDQLSRTMFTEHLKWKTEADGRRIGNYVDASPTARIIALVRWIEFSKDEFFVPLLQLSLKNLKIDWTFFTPNTGALIHVVDELDNAPWLLIRDGKVLRDKLLEAALKGLSYASHSEWSSFLKYKMKQKKWTAEQLSQIDKALEDYCDSGAGDERYNCSSKSDLEDLLQGLTQLKIDYQLPLDSDISLTASAIEDFEEPEKEPPSEEDDEPTLPTMPANWLDEDDEEMGDLEIKRLFGSLEE